MEKEHFERQGELSQGEKVNEEKGRQGRVETGDTTER